MDWNELTQFRVQCILGVLDREQREPQALDIDLKLALNLESAGELDDLERSVDYAAVMELVSTIALEGRWRLLESMALAIARLLLAVPAFGEGRAQIEAVEVRLRKPDILAPRATPGIGLIRDRMWCRLENVEVAPGVSVEVLQENARNGAYRIHLAPGARWQVPSELSLQVIAGQLEPALPRMSKLERGAGRVLVNASKTPACLLGVAFPVWVR